MTNWFFYLINTKMFTNFTIRVLGHNPKYFVQYFVYGENVIWEYNIQHTYQPTYKHSKQVYHSTHYTLTHTQTQNNHLKCRPRSTSLVVIIANTTSVTWQPVSRDSLWRIARHVTAREVLFCLSCVCVLRCHCDARYHGNITTKRLHLSSSYCRPVVLCLWVHVS